MRERTVEDAALVDAVRLVLRTGSRPTVHCATAQVNADALDRLRKALAEWEADK